MAIPKAISESSFTVFGVTLRCYVLDDGRRIINAEDVERLFEIMAHPSTPSVSPDFEAFTKWTRGE